jgi:cytidyltransferase-like protein
MPRVYTGGTFDLLHPGHIHLLRRCRELAGPRGSVTVALNSDEFVQEYKGITPTFDFRSRWELLTELRCVDLVFPNIGGADSRPTIDLVDPDIIAIGEDWKDRDYHAQMGFDQQWLDARGIEIVYIDHLPGFSSTNVRQSLAR